jgi:hypothetical protein
LTWLDGFTAHFLSLDIFELLLHICGLLLFGFLCEVPWGSCRAYAPVLLYLCVGAPLTNYVGCGMLGVVSVLAGSYVAVNVALIHRKAEPSMIVKLSSVCYTIITQTLHCCCTDVMFLSVPHICRTVATGICPDHGVFLRVVPVLPAQGSR